MSADMVPGLILKTLALIFAGESSCLHQLLAASGPLEHRGQRATTPDYFLDGSGTPTICGGLPRAELEMARRGFTDDITGERYAGITALLERVFWPGYKYRRALSRGAAGVSTKVRVDVDTSSGLGFARGTAVDAEVCNFVNHGVPPSLGYTRKVLKSLQLADLKPERGQVGEPLWENLRFPQPPSLAGEPTWRVPCVTAGPTK